MIFEEDHIYIGKLLKTHGYKGKILIHFESFTDGYLKEKEFIFLEIEGIRVPFFIESAENAANNKYIIKLTDINSDQEVEEFLGCKIYLSGTGSNDINQAFENEGFINWKLKDTTSKKEGKVIEFIEIPGNPLLKVLINDDKEYNIPFNKDFIKKTDFKKKLLVMNLPEGLLD